MLVYQCYSISLPRWSTCSSTIDDVATDAIRIVNRVDIQWCQVGPRITFNIYHHHNVKVIYLSQLILNIWSWSCISNVYLLPIYCLYIYVYTYIQGDIPRVGWYTSESSYIASPR